MLDNSTMATTAATMPIEILADAKILKTKEKVQQSENNLPILNSNQIKTNKTKTILNWLKNSTTTTKNNYNTNLTSDNNIEINSCHHNQFDKVRRQQQPQQQQQQPPQTQDIPQKLATLEKACNDCTCPTVKQQNSTRSNKLSTLINNNNTASHRGGSSGGAAADDDTLREFRGVQTLKYFWNKRITANKESALRAKGCKHQNKQFTKSISCLVNVGEPPPSSPLSSEEHLRVRKLRALSLHDCSHLQRDDSSEFEEISLSDIEIQRHLEKDNFYKYKTAEQALKLRELSEHSAVRKLSNGIVIPKTERLNWLKRHDIFGKRKPLEDLSHSPDSVVMKNDFNNSKIMNGFDDNDHSKLIITGKNNDIKDDSEDIVINEHTHSKMCTNEDSTTLPTASCQNNNEVGNTASESSTPTVTATNSPQHLVSRRQLTTRKDSSKTLTSASSISRDSSAASLTASTGPRSNVKRNSSTRKYSFKTHSRSYHAPRKMHANKEHVVAAATTGQVVLNHPNSLVAKLTQQFNEIIQKDKTFMEEIKRKNGVIMTHKGHVYKVVDTSSLQRNQSPSVSRSSSKAQDRSVTEKSTIENRVRSSGSTVQKNIKKFESESRGLKPKVPLKSIQVLKKSNELVINKQGAGNRVTANRSINKKDMEMKAEIKPQTLNIPSVLEMVKEEAKTPVENKEIGQDPRILDPRILDPGILDPNSNTISEENKDSQTDSNREIITNSQQTLENQNEEESHQEHSLTQETPDSIATPNSTIPQIESVLFKTFKDSPRNIKDNSTISLSEISHVSMLATEDKQSLEEKEKEEKKQEEILEINKEDYSKENQQQTNLDNDNKENKISALKSELKTQLSDDADNNKNQELEFSRNGLIDEGQQPSITEESKTDICKDYQKENTSSPTKTNESPESPYENVEDKKSKSKHRYSKIYEKLRIVNPFAHANKKQKLTSPKSNDSNKSLNSTPPKQQETNAKSSEISETSENLEKSKTTKTLPTNDYTPMSSPTPRAKLNSANDYSIMSNPEAKILDALEEVDKKLQNLNHDSGSDTESNVVLLESDEYGQPIKPNSSFLHQKYAKDILTKPVTIVQAVNVTLVNAIEGEQMIMEQKELQLEMQNRAYVNDPAAVSPCKEAEEEEPLYEPIGIAKLHQIEKEESHELSNGSVLKTSEHSSSSIDLSINGLDDAIEEDIYQTVEEVKKVYTPVIVKNSSPELDGYEPIENPNESTLTLKCNLVLTQKIIHFDGYEECTPPVDTTPFTPSTLGVRKVTDELPDLPQPKRILPKSPLPLRTAPKPPLPIKHINMDEEEEDESEISPLQESHYEFGVDENIYDTIKGSHCYESLSSTNNKLQNCPINSSTNTHSKNPDSVSLSSNCYESISHYKRTTIISHLSGSSNGSTMTISSDTKTNSLYDGSLPSSLHYSSKRIYRSNTHAHIEIQKTTDVNSVNGYGTASIGRRSDTSDEWTDVTDNENDDEAEAENNKPQFIIVRERSKAHKSPDWSRRVRDKRQRKSKSCIEEDDPDHYYEQLSPQQALTKRQSLHEQTHANSLQRNQDSIRVSKRGKQMSYSAHALGQHISDDSFDSDTDDYYEKELFKNSHNDSGVDIRTTKLPEPPASSNQMYSIVKKFKNFIVNKKSPNSSKHGGSQQKIYDNTSQFYVNGQFDGKSPSSSLLVPETKELSTSEKNLILAQSTVSKPEALNTSTTPRKPKSGKSLKSRIRKSLVGFDNKQLSTLTPTRSTFYIEDPPVQDENSGQMDSGFSEKALSGDLPTTTSTPTSEAHKFATLARKAKKEAKIANAQRRRTTIGSIRPHEPPPPPPPADSTSKSRRQSNTSWYAECGVFKNGTTNLVHDDSQILNSQTGGSGSSFAAGSTWYEEAGLYQTSGISVASSSGSSGVSTSNEAGPADEMSHSMFSNEPLYQIYSAAKLEAISRDMQQDESSTDGYEEIGDRLRNSNVPEGSRKSSRPSALQLIEPKGGPERTLWSQIPEVINSFIIPTMTQRERSLMEAKFEVITSEASYLKSLNLLRTHYMNHPIFRDTNIVSSRDRKFLFAHIVPVHECSEKLLTELESCWQDNIMLLGLSKRIYAIAEKHFHVYIGFCEHQGRMDRTLKRLREGKGLFSQNLELLESSPACCGLNLHSFLMLPMQRITRLPLLIDAVFSKCHPNDDEYENWKMCLAIMNKIVTQCNEAANKSEQCFEIERISRQLEFNPSSIRPLAIAPAGVLAPGTKPRFLVKKGELTHLIWRGDDAKLTFGKKFSKTTVFAFLFSDLLVLTKRKADEHFSVFDYCPRNMLTITSGDTLPQLPTKDLNSQTSKNLILMTLLENHERKTVELLLSCPSVSEQERWLQAMRPPESETPGEKLYEQWDCPQVIAKHLYENNEPDVLNLEVGDVVNVTRKLPDGWYKGERIRDGAVGWFPGSYTEEVNSVHVRARNLKQRHRLLTFTATYLESQKRNK